MCCECGTLQSPVRRWLVLDRALMRSAQKPKVIPIPHTRATEFNCYAYTRRHCTSSWHLITANKTHRHRRSAHSIPTQSTLLPLLSHASCALSPLSSSSSSSPVCRVQRGGHWQKTACPSFMFINAGVRCARSVLRIVRRIRRTLTVCIYNHNTLTPTHGHSTHTHKHRHTCALACTPSRPTR